MESQRGRLCPPSREPGRHSFHPEHSDSWGNFSGPQQGYTPKLEGREKSLPLPTLGFCVFKFRNSLLPLSHCELLLCPPSP